MSACDKVLTTSAIDVSVARICADNAETQRVVRFVRQKDKMTTRLPPGLRAFVVSLFAAAALTACGGGGGVDSPAAVALAVDDAASVDWNRASILSVTNNDTIQNGTATIAIKTAPLNGTATVTGTTISYTPTAGYFGTDTLRYSLTVGDRTVEAGVQMTVSAVLTLSGTVRDNPLPGATVTATVGSAVITPVTADASGNYTMTLRVADPAAFISLKAKGAGAQSAVVLSSLVGEAGEAAAAAAASTGVVNATALPSANVTHVSTAIAVLAQQSLGKTIGSAADLKAAQGSFTASQTIEMATAIKLVADSGIALPPGMTDTLALVSNASAFKNFVVTQITTNTAAYNAVLQNVLGDAALAVAPQIPSASNPVDKVLLLVQGEGASARSATRLTLKANGSAIVESDAVRSAKWTASGTEISVTYDIPAVGEGYSSIDAQGNQWRIQVTRSSFVVRQLGGSNSGSPASVKAVSSSKFLEGPLSGTAINETNDWDAQTLIGNPAALVAADVMAGTRWAGVLAYNFSPLNASYVDQDVAKIIDATTITFERAAKTGTYRLVEGKLEITIEGAVFTYSRLFNGPRGEQRWLVVKSVNGVVQWVYEPAVVKAQATSVFTVAGLTQPWESYINVGSASGKFIIDLGSAGAGLGISLDASGKQIGTATSGLWALNSDGAMTLKRYRCDIKVAGCLPWHQRTWTLLATAEKRIYVMERLKINDNYDQYRVNVYTKP